MSQKLSDQSAISEKLQKRRGIYGERGGNPCFPAAQQRIFRGDFAVYEGMETVRWKIISIFLTVMS